MNIMNQSLLYALLMLIAGMGIPIMAALNGGLGAKLANPPAATVMLFAVGLAAASAFLFLSQGMPTLARSQPIPFIYFLGGLFVLFYVLTISWVAPRFGLGNAIAFVLLGQLLSMSVIDHFGLLSAQLYTITPRRVIGLVLMAAGVFFVVKR